MIDMFAQLHRHHRDGATCDRSSKFAEHTKSNKLSWARGLPSRYIIVLIIMVRFCLSSVSAEGALQEFPTQVDIDNSQSLSHSEHFSTASSADYNFTITSVEPHRKYLTIFAKVVTTSSVTVRCGAFTGQTNVTAQAISMKQNSYNMPSSGTFAMNLTGLVPLTDYKVYCTSQGTDVPATTPASIQRTKKTAKTACCREVQVTLSLHSMFINDGAYLNAVLLSVDALPAVGLTAGISFESSPGVASSVVLFPAVLDWLPTSPLAYQSASIVPGVAEVQQLVVTLSGASKDDYTVVYAGSRTLTVSSSEDIPPVPEPLQAVFSSDGGSVSLTFSSPTDKGGYANTFPCAKLLTFVGSATAVCVWSDASTIVIYPKFTTVANTLAVLSPISIVGDKLRAQCSATLAAFECDAHETVPITQLLVAIPAMSVAPFLVIAMPSSIDACSALTVDLTNSVGAAGRPWQSLTFAVFTAAGNTAPARRLQNFLNHNYTLNPPTSIPYTAFAKGYLYTVQVTLCNFLGSCTLATAKVNVTTSQASVPVVSILGAGTRTARRNAVLTVNSNAFVQPCGGGVSSADLEYAWVVRTVLGSGALASTTLRSVSQSPAVFKLNAYSLEVGTTYQVTLTVRALRSVPVQSASASILVTVPAGNLVASIAGGALKYVMVGDSFTLDASKSYDEDRQGVTGAAAGLSFSWACLQQQPEFSSNCLLERSASTSPTYNVTAHFNSLNTTSQFTVTVSSGARPPATSVVTVIVAGSRMPALGITSAATLLTNVNTGKAFVLYGQAKIVAPCAARWSVDDTTFSLAAVSSTVLTKTLLPVASSAAVPFNLVINPGALPQRSTLVFTLSCGAAATSVSVTTNGAPLPGEFVVTPVSGEELNTLFSYSARQWTDSDLPLTYQFGFVSETSLSNLVVVSKSEFAYTSTTLPAGLASLDNRRNCTLDVFDNMNAFTSDVSIVTVHSTTDEQKDVYLLQLLQSNTGTVDSTKNILSVVSTALNAVNCSAAPNCTTLHRAGCVRTTGECGACLSGYIGDAGDRSTVCIPADVAAVTTVTSCVVNADCPAYTSCDTSSNTCVTAAKVCSQGCSGHGACIYVSKLTSQELPACRLANLDCDAICSCEASYSGEFCEISDNSLQTRRAVRSTLVASLGNLTTVDDINAQSVAAWSASLYSLSIHPHELSEQDVKSVALIANITLRNAIELGVDSYADIAGVLQATDTVASLLRYNYNPNDYKDENFSGARVYENNTAALTVQTVSSFADLVTQNMVLGQETTSFLYDNFRMSVSLSEVSAANITLRAPENAAEDAAGMAPSTAAILPYADLDTFPSSVAVKVISVPPRSFTPDPAAFVSTPLMLQIQTQGGADTDPTEFLSSIEFTLQNNDVRTDFIAPVVKNFTTQCVAGDRGRVFQYTCPVSEEKIVHTCGVIGTYVSYCKVPTPTCARLDVSTAALSFLDSCYVKAFNTTYTTCVCELTTSARKLSEQRRLRAQSEDRGLASVESNLLDQSGATCMMTSTMFIASDFANTFNAAGGFTSPSDAARVIVVIVMMGIIWVSGLFVIGYEYVAPKKAEKDDAKSEKVEVQQQRIVLNYVESVIPSVFKEGGSTTERIWAEVVEHHLVFKLISKQSAKKRREIIFKTMTMFTYMLFLIVIFFDVSNPGDDGSCKLRTNAEDCLNRVSPFDSKQNFCSWNGDTDKCVYNSESMTINAMFYLTVLTTVMTALATIPLDYFFGIISAPVAKQLEGNKVETMYTALQAGVRRASVAGGRARQATQRVAPAPSMEQGSSRKTIMGIPLSEKISVVANRDISEEIVTCGEAARKSMHLLIKKNQAITMQTTLSTKTLQARSSKRLTRMKSVRYGHDDKSLNKTSDPGHSQDTRRAEAPYVSDAYYKANEAEQRYIQSVGRVTLIDELLQQRVLMNDDAAETKVFDAQWGLYKDLTPVATDLYRLYPSARRVISEATFDTDEEAKNIAADLRDYSKPHAGLEVLHLFMVDLLGKQTAAAKIFKEKFGEEFEDSHAVQLWQKYLATAVVFGLNGFFIYYVLLKALQKGYEWQIQFLTCFLLQFAVEILIFETMECVWLNFSVPTFVRRDVAAAMEKLRAQVDLVAPSDEGKQVDTSYLVNAPAHIFVSVKVAKQHPQLLESMIVSCYAHHLPGEICRTWEHYRPYLDEQDPDVQDRYSAWGPAMRPVLRGLSLSLQIFITIPYLYQRITIRFVQPMIISAITIAWFYAISSATAIGIMVGVILVLIAFIAWRRYVYVQEQRQTQLAVSPDDEFGKDFFGEPVPTFVEDDEDDEEGGDGRSSNSTGTEHTGSTHHTHASHALRNGRHQPTKAKSSQQSQQSQSSAAEEKSGDGSSLDKPRRSRARTASASHAGELHKPLSSVDKSSTHRSDHDRDHSQAPGELYEGSATEFDDEDDGFDDMSFLSGSEMDQYLGIASDDEDA